MKIDGKFIEMNIQEFKQWLLDNSFSRKVNIIQNHHTYLPDYKTYEKNKAKISNIQFCKNMENFHVKERGFSEIAQNITTFPDGNIVICRSLNKIPSGIKGANTYGICIEHLGNFDDGKDQMTSKHRDTIVKVNALLCIEFEIEPSDKTIVYHHWYDLVTGKRKDGEGSTKSCPGTNFFGGNTVEDFNNVLLPFINVVMHSYKNMSMQ